MNYIILNDVNSNTIQGLIIQNLPPITKPQIRTNIEEIDGRDGDIITKLGYSAYEKEFDIGLYGNYDVDQVISYFNSEGTVIFSNEDDKFYKYSIIEQIDFERLIRFKTAKVKMHVQPFKYSNTDTDIEIYATETDAEGTNLTIDNTENGASFLDMQLKGQTTQDGTPTPSAPVNVNVVTGNTSVKICNKNLLNISNIETGTKNGVTLNLDEDKIIINGTCTSYTIFNIPCELSGENMYSSTNWNGYVIYGQYKGSGVTSFTSNRTYNGNIDRLVIGIQPNTSFNNQTIQLQVEKNNTATSYVAHQEQNYTINLGKNLIVDETFVQGAYFDNTTTTRISCRNTKLKANTTYTLSSNLNYTNFNIAVATQTQPFPNNLTLIYDSTWKGGNFSFTTGDSDVYTNISIRKPNNATITPSDVEGIKIQIEVGSTATSYAPYFTPIELCQIGQYQDYIYKNNGKWFIHQEIEKITLNGSETPTINTVLTNTTRALYSNILPYNSKGGAGSGICNLLPYYENWVTDVEGFYLDNNTTNLVFRINKSTVGTTITSVNNFLSENNMTVYYILATPTETQITDENLIAQLDALKGASTYINQTNIITSGDLAPIIYVNVDTIDTNEIEVVNSGNIYSKPVVTITGIGTINLYLNDYQVFILELGDTETTITLDVENMEAYNINTGQLMNRQVTGDYNNFIFNAGTNIITWSGTIASVQVVNYSRWI